MKQISFLGDIDAEKQIDSTPTISEPTIFNVNAGNESSTLIVTIDNTEQSIELTLNEQMISVESTNLPNQLIIKNASVTSVEQRMLNRTRLKLFQF